MSALEEVIGGVVAEKMAGELGALRELVTQLSQALPVQLLTIDQAAGELLIGKTKFYELLDRGELEWVQVGGHRRIARSEIDRYIRDNSRRAVPA